MKLKDNNDEHINPNINWAPLLASYIDFCNYKTIVEIGVQYGHTTQALCEIASKIGGKVYGYDFFGPIGAYNGQKGIPITPDINTIKSDLEKHGYGSEVLKLTKVNTQTDEFAKILKEDTKGKIDFAFIDGCHSYSGTRNDFEKVYPLLESEGTIVFHDTFSHAGTRAFVHDLRVSPELNDGTYDLINLPFGGGPGTQPFCRIGMVFLVKRGYAKSFGGIINNAHDKPPLDPDYIYETESRWLDQQIKAWDISIK